MNEAVLRMITAGVLFGMWPLIMNKSGLSGNTSTVLFTAVILVIVVPVGMYTGFTLSGSKWWFAVIAACAGALGLLIFNTGLSKAAPEEVGKLFVILTVVQVAIPACYHVYLSGELTLKTGIGFAAAVLAAILLL